MGGYERHSAPWALDGHLVDRIPADFNGRLLEEDWPRFEEIAENSRAPRAGDGGRQGHAADQRPRGVHARQRVLPRRDRRARLLRGRRLLRPRPRRRRRDRQGDGRVDRRRRAGARRVGDGHPALRPAVPLARATRSSARKEVYETYYDIRYPGHERQAGRPLRTSSAYPWHREHGAAFGEKSGWERVNWYEPTRAARRRAAAAARLGGDALVAGDRRRGARPRASAPGLFDESSFAKLELSRARGGRAARAPVRQPRRARRRRDHLHADAQPPRRDRVRLHGHARRGGALPDRHRDGVRQPRRELDPQPPARRRLGRPAGRDLALGVLRPLGPAGPRDPARR